MTKQQMHDQCQAICEEMNAKFSEVEYTYLSENAKWKKGQLVKFNFLTDGKPTGVQGCITRIYLMVENPLVAESIHICYSVMITGSKNDVAVAVGSEIHITEKLFMEIVKPTAL